MWVGGGSSFFDVIGPDTTVFAIIEGDYWGDEYATRNALKKARKNKNPNKAHTHGHLRFLFSHRSPLDKKQLHLYCREGGSRLIESGEGLKCNLRMSELPIILGSV